MGEDNRSKEEREFFEKYMTTTDIMNFLDIGRPSIFNARLNGKLPGAINVHNQFYLWEREKVMPYLESWKRALAHRRGNVPGINVQAS